MPDDARPTTIPRIGGSRSPLRHDMPAVDEAGLVAARCVDRMIAAAREAGSDRWLAYFEPMADRLRDDEPRGLRQVALRARAAYWPKDSVRDALPEDVTEPFLEAIDRLLKQLNRREVG
jgi:hypothetical protein